MTSSRATSHANTFALRASALSAPKISLPLADHNAPLVGDELFTVALNYQWRRVLVHLAGNMLDRRIYDGTEAEIDTAVQQVHDLLSSMYTENPQLEVKKIAARVRSTAAFTATPVGAKVPFDDPATMADAYDTDGFWTIAQPALLMVPAGLGGFYRCIGSVRFNSGPLAQLSAKLETLPHGVIAQEVGWTTGKAGFNFVQDVELDEGDWVALNLHATVNRSVSILSTSSPTLSLHRLDGGLVPIT